MRITFIILSLIAATCSAFGAEVRDPKVNLFYDVEALVERQADVSKMIELMGPVKSEEILPNGQKRYSFFLPTPGLYIPRKGRWVGVTVRTLHGKIATWDPLLSDSDLLGPDGRRLLARVADIGRIPIQSVKISDLLTDFKWLGKPKEMDDEERKWMVDYILGWEKFATEHKQDPSVPRQSDFARVAEHLSIWKGRGPLPKGDENDRISLADLGKLLR